MMRENELSKLIVDTSYRIHVELGPGLFESVYEEIMHYELLRYGLHVDRQKEIPLIWKEVILDRSFKADLIVENLVLIEIKSIETIASVHQKQVLTYLRLTRLKLGLLINFNEQLIKNGITRIVNNL